MISSIPSSLQMNYVETFNSTPAQEKPRQKAEEPGKETPPAEKNSNAAAADAPQPPAVARDPKYHKSYGAE